MSRMRSEVQQAMTAMILSPNGEMSKVTEVWGPIDASAFPNVVIIP